jgi:transcription termination factor Rho
MSARTQLQSKPVADLRAIAEGLGLEHKGLQKAKLIDLLLEQGDTVIEAEEPVVAEVISKNDDSDLPSVVNSGDSQVKAGESREGILDILPEGYGFLRCNGYKPGDNDVYVPAGSIKKYRMRKGDLVEGPIRAPRQKEKFPALVEPKTVNGADPELLARRVDFNKLTPLFPDERLKLEVPGKPEKIVGRIIDLIAPIGKGQRGLIVSPPKAGKTTILKEIANSITANNPEVHLMVVLVDERPEEVTDMQRSVDGEVIYSTFDRPPEEHTQVSRLAIERAKRLTEEGKDVVILLDSITRLARAHNLASPASGRILSGGLDSTAITPVKQFFGAARNIEGGGSLTILGTALVETGSKMDEVIFEEFKGTGNMELQLDRRISNRRIFPAIDLVSSSTRRDDLLLDENTIQRMWIMRKYLADMNPVEAMEFINDRFRKTKSNEEFLISMNT